MPPVYELVPDKVNVVPPPSFVIPTLEFPLIIPEKITSLSTVKLRVAAPSPAFAAKVNTPVFVPLPSVTFPPIVIAL